MKYVKIYLTIKYVDMTKGSLSVWRPVGTFFKENLRDKCTRFSYSDSSILSWVIRAGNI